MRFAVLGEFIGEDGEGICGGAMAGAGFNDLAWVLGRQWLA